MTNQQRLSAHLDRIFRSRWTACTGCVMVPDPKCPVHGKKAKSKEQHNGRQTSISR